MIARPLTLSHPNRSHLPASSAPAADVTLLDKRELFTTAVIAREGNVFKEGEIVSVSVHLRMPKGPWLFRVQRGDRVDVYSEGFLRNFVL